MIDEARARAKVREIDRSRREFLQDVARVIGADVSSVLSSDHFDLVIKNDDMTPEQVVKRIERLVTDGLDRR